jgi:hypothetical protein
VIASKVLAMVVFFVIGNDFVCNTLAMERHLVGVVEYFQASPKQERVGGDTRKISWSLTLHLMPPLGERTIDGVHCVTVNLFMVVHRRKAGPFFSDAPDLARCTVFPVKQLADSMYWFLY